LREILVYWFYLAPSHFKRRTTNSAAKLPFTLCALEIE
jgi:hypothetical protein